MKKNSAWAIALAVILTGCAGEKHALVDYHQPLTSPGGEFSTLPPAVQNSVRAEAGAAEISSISKVPSGNSTIYEFQFADTAIYPPLYVASDGSVLTSNLNVAVGASEGAISASTGAGSNGIKLDDLPVAVVNTIRSRAPTAEVDSVHKITAGDDTFYDVFFKDPEHHPKLLISDDGRVVK